MSSLQAHAQGKAARTVANDCAVELQTFCPAITPGKSSRKVACLIAHSDKISARCRLTAYVAGKAMAEGMLRLNRLAFSCSADIASLCDKVPIGGGRIYDCLRKNKARLVAECRTALPKFEKEYMR